MTKWVLCHAVALRSSEFLSPFLRCRNDALTKYAKKSSDSLKFIVFRDRS